MLVFVLVEELVSEAQLTRHNCPWGDTIQSVEKIISVEVHVDAFWIAFCNWTEELLLIDDGLRSIVDCYQMYVLTCN